MAEGLNAFAHVRAAAMGDLAAQRALADEAVRRMTISVGGQDCTATMLEGLVFARLAAAHGGVGDQGRVVSMLVLLAELYADDEDSTSALVGEAIARMEMLADAGREDAALAVSNCAAAATRQTMQAAQHFRRLLNDTRGD